MVLLVRYYSNIKALLYLESLVVINKHAVKEMSVAHCLVFVRLTSNKNKYATVGGRNRNVYGNQRGWYNNK